MGPPRGGGGGTSRAVEPGSEEKYNSGVEKSVISLTIRKDI